MASFYDLDSVWRDRAAYPNPCNYQVTAQQIETWSKQAREISSLPRNPNLRPLEFVSSINVINLTLPYPRIELYADTMITVDSILATVLTTLTPHGLALNDILQTSLTLPTIGIDRNVQYHVVAVPTPTTFQISLTSGGAVYAVGNGTGLDLVFSLLTAAVDAALTDAQQLLTYPRIYLNFHSKTYDDLRMLNTIGGRLAEARFVLFIDHIQYDDRGTPIWIHYRTNGMEQVMRFQRKDILILTILSRDGTIIPFFIEADRTIPTNPEKQCIATFCITPYIRDADYVNHEVEPMPTK